MKPIKVFICDDHKLMLDGLGLILGNEENIQIVGRGYNGQELLDWLEVHVADVVLLDINMPVLDGIKTARIIYDNYPDLKVVFLSMINQSEIISSLHKSRAKGFLLKNADKKEVINAILTVAKGGTTFDKNLISKEEPTFKRRPNQYLPKLTAREKEVLKLIINENTSTEIAQKLFISLGTVETHRRNLISKLGVKNTAGLVRIALEYSLVD